MNSGTITIPGFCNRIVLLFILTLLLTACSRIPSVPVQDDLKSLTSPVAYYLWIKSASSAEISLAYRQLRQRTDMEPVIRLVRLALLSSVPEGTGADDNRHALAYLDEAIVFPRSPESGLASDYREFSLLWQNILRQRRRLTRMQNALETELEDMRQQFETLKVEKLQHLETLLADKRKKIETLARENEEMLKKIEGLKTIEQQINERIIPIDDAE